MNFVSQRPDHTVPWSKVAVAAHLKNVKVLSIMLEKN
jgi:hypothetical protein